MTDKNSVSRFFYSVFLVGEQDVAIVIVGNFKTVQR